MGLFSRKRKDAPSVVSTMPPAPPPKVQSPAVPPQGHLRQPNKPLPQSQQPAQPPAIPIHSRPPRQQQQQQVPTHPAVLTPGSGGSAPGPTQFHPAGYLPPPPGWTPPTGPYSYHRPVQPIVVNQHYYLLGASPPAPNAAGTLDQNLGQIGGALSKLDIVGAVAIARDAVPATLAAAGLGHAYDEGLAMWQAGSVPATQVINQTAALVDQIAGRFNHVMTMIDRESYTGKNEVELQDALTTPVAVPATAPPGMVHELEAVVPAAAVTRGIPTQKAKGGSGGSGKKGSKTTTAAAPKGQTTAMAATVVSGNYFAKVEMYANSRLPMQLPPLRLYSSTWPLLCLAASYAERVYDTPHGAERNAHVPANWRSGTKAMTIKSVPMDDRDVIVFAVRGTATFMDWAVNLNSAPVSPAGFLEDAGNLCHAGFLSVARNMVRPVAARLRQLLEEDPGRSAYSLVITGHSAGGAIAALLYSHMLSTAKEAESELSILTGCFKRVHCITFGAPPVSLLPLRKPDRPGLRSSVFMSFVNEGDPVARADRAYVKSLLELFASPAPVVVTKRRKTTGSGDEKGEVELVATRTPRHQKSKTSLASKASKKSAKSNKSATTTVRPVWRVPPSTLSNAGRVVVLRSGDPKARLRGKRTVEERLDEGVVAQTVEDEQLRGVVWGDPVCHLMRLYSGRIETLAIGAVTGKKS